MIQPNDKAVHFNCVLKLTEVTVLTEEAIKCFS